MHETGIQTSDVRRRMAAIYERRQLSPEDRAKTQRSANGIRRMIVDFFEAFPHAKVSPSEFKELMDLPNPIHSIRPRFTELAGEKGGQWLQVLSTDKVPSLFGGHEHRYQRSLDNGQYYLQLPKE